MNAPIAVPGAERPSQSAALDYVRSGQIPFFRLPSVDPTSPGSLEGAGAVLLGVPWDGGSTYQAGSKLAPWHVRRVSALMQGFHPVHRIDVFRGLRPVDGGNVAFPPFDPSAMRESVEEATARIHAAGAVPILLGGDHSIALPALRAAAARHGALAVVHVDAHYDTSDATVWGDAHHHGTPLRHAVLEGLVARGQLHQVAVRATTSDEQENRWSRGHGARVRDMEEVAELGVERVAGEILREIAGRPTYVTFDVDAIDPAFAPGTGTPVSGGLTSREAIRFLRCLEGLHLVGMDVVEVSPNLDHADLTSHLAAQLLYEGLALAALDAR